MSGHLDGPPPGPPDPPYIEGDMGAPSAEEFALRRGDPAHSIRPVHGDVWAVRAGPSQRFSVMHICGHHDPPHVTGYWNLHGGSGAGRHGEIPLPRFLDQFKLVSREGGSPENPQDGLPDIEALCDALRFYADERNYTAQNPPGSGAHIWRDHGNRAREALLPCAYCQSHQCRCSEEWGPAEGNMNVRRGILSNTLDR